MLKESGQQCALLQPLCPPPVCPPLHSPSARAVASEAGGQPGSADTRPPASGQARGRPADASARRAAWEQCAAVHREPNFCSWEEGRTLYKADQAGRAGGPSV